MAHPKRQHSKQRSRKRRTHQNIEENFGSLSMEGSKSGSNHRVDPITGFYKGVQVIEVKQKKSKEKEAK